MREDKKIYITDKKKNTSVSGKIYTSDARVSRKVSSHSNVVRDSRKSAFIPFVILLAVCLLWSCFSKWFYSGSSVKELVINEIITNNVSAICDESGRFSDVIEIKNTGDGQISLSGMGLTDSEGKARYKFGDVTLAAGEIKLIFCGNDFPFSIKKDGGETIRLTDRLGRTICSVETVSLEGNESLSWTGTEYEVTEDITPGYENDQDGRELYIESRQKSDSPIAISEAVTENVAAVPGGAQLIEVQNISSESVNIADFYISDDTVELFRFRLPAEELGAGEVRVFTFGTEDADGLFSFGSEEYICLSYKDGTQISQIPVVKEADCAISLLGDGSYDITNVLSVGYPNTQEGEEAYADEHPLGDVIISEVLTNNDDYLYGGTGAPDYVEIYNRTDEEIDLSEYYLSDDSGDLFKAALSGTIEPYGYRTFLCSKDGEKGDWDYTHLSLALSKEGEVVILSKNGEAVQCLQVPALDCECSYGLSPDETYAVLSEPTPGYSNSESAQKCAAPTASVPGGVYENVSNVVVELSGEGEIRYTLDCTEPDSSSLLYKGPITLNSTSVIRARCYKDGYDAGEIFTATYIINEGHTLEVACIVSDPDGLFSYDYGIYSTGPGASEESPHYGANYWMSWEREATVAFYAEDGGFDLPCGIRIFGGYSRSLSQKALSVTFRGKYGASCLDYKLFGDEGLDSYENFVFRAAGQDCYYAHMRDPLATTIFRENIGGALTQKYRPVVLYINGEYWGVYYIREKINENFIAGNCNVDEESVTLSMQLGSSSSEYRSLVSWASSHDLSDQENWDYIESQMNVESYMNYLITEIYSGNFDKGNVRFFKSPDYDNGRWNWILYDIDWAMYFRNSDSIDEFFSDNVVYSADLIRALLENDAFKERFFTEMARQINEVWNTEVIASYVKQFYDMIEPEMERNCDRWNWDFSYWQEEVEWINTFAQCRPAVIYESVQNYFGFSDSQMEAYGFTKGE